MPEAGPTPDTVRVLCLHTATQPPLGADTWIHAQIIRHLDRSTHEIHVACRTTAGGAPTPTYDALRDIPDIDVVPVDLGPELFGRSRFGKLRGMLATLPALVSLVRLVVLVRRRRIRLIHTSDRPRDAFAAVLIGRLTGAVSVVHVHVTYNPTWMGWMLRWSLAHADALIAVSSFVGQTLEAGGQAADRIHVVRNGIDVEAWQPGSGRQQARRELEIADDVPVVVIVCRLFPEKGPADLIRAISAVRDQFADVVLLVVGVPLDPAYGAELAALAGDLGMEEHVRFLGRRPDVPAIMAASDVFAMPSHDEPFGLVFVEAMAMRLPVVAVADGGTLEIVEHGRTGLLSRWGDGAQLAADLRTLLGDQELRDAMGAAGRHRAIDRFTVERMATDVARVYRLIA
ncbi:MAG: glycosyltransferase family 4 protein [Ilumatobacteraceae bacterium]